MLYKILLFLISFNIFAQVDYGEAFYIENNQENKEETRILLGTNTDNNLLISYNLNISQKIYSYKLHSLWGEVILRDNQKTAAANAIDRAENIEQTVFEPGTSLFINHNYELLKGNVSLLNKYYNRISISTLLGYGQTSYESNTLDNSEKVNSIQVGMIASLNFTNQSLVFAYKRQFDNFDGDISFEYNEFSVGIGLSW